MSNMTKDMTVMTDKAREEARKFLRTLEDESNKLANELFVADTFARIRQEARADLQDEIDLTYEMWCGRSYMHLPLHEAVGEAIKYDEAEARREAAEVAVYWMHQEFPTQDDPVRQQTIDDSLRSAILSDEPTKEVE